MNKYSGTPPDLNIIYLPYSIAKDRDISLYFTGKACKRGHLYYRYSANAGCVICHSQNRYELHVDYYSRTKSDRMAYQKKWDEQNPERRKMLRKKWWEENPEKTKAIANSTSSRRRSSKILRQPLWADKHRIFEMYLLCSEYNSRNGAWVVDHYYPLQGKTVSGLHCADNLRIISAEENSLKSNKHPDDWEKEKALKGLSFPVTPI